MATAFQLNAFQNNAFQIDAVEPPTAGFTAEQIGPDEDHTFLARWIGLAVDDIGEPIGRVARDRCWQAFGTFGAGGTVVIEGSNDGDTYSTLTTRGGGAAQFAAAGVLHVVEIPRYVRPRVSAGSGATAVTVTLALRPGFR
jgi:hypothetical protein